MNTNTTTALHETWTRDGFVNVGTLLSSDEVAAYRALYDRFLDGTIDCADKRGDLGTGNAATGGAEAITQIMWPSALAPEVHNMPLHHRALSLAKDLVGDDVELDFDMLIDKAPGSDTPTPWHQDAAYWIDLPDTRALSLWVALDHADLDNGCMWYVTGSHTGPIRPHRPTGRGAALRCDCSEDEPGATPVPIPSGHGIAHAGGTLHYSRGNTATNRHRRAYILNYRPAAMIALEREKGMDHGLSNNERKIRNTAAGN
jgi:ectoine hydroxylase-related dioxygenase (phytanoyl-CoA dioxygenase family)